MNATSIYNEIQSALKGGERVAAVPAHRGKIGDQRGHIIGPQKIIDDDKIERVALQRGGPQPFEVEDHRSHRYRMSEQTITAHRGTRKTPRRHRRFRLAAALPLG